SATFRSGTGSSPTPTRTRSVHARTAAAPARPPSRKQSSHSHSSPSPAPSAARATDRRPPRASGGRSTALSVGRGRSYPGRDAPANGFPRPAHAGRAVSAEWQPGQRPPGRTNAERGGRVGRWRDGRGELEVRRRDEDGGGTVRVPLELACSYRARTRGL